MRVGDAPIITTSKPATKIPGATEPASSDESHADAKSFGVVYVNDIGREAMFSKVSTRFPIGSMIVREKLLKLSARGGGSGPGPSPPPKEPAQEGQMLAHLITIEDFGPPEILVVMLKREKGFNPKANDWEFLTVSGDAKKIAKREKDGACRQCHASQANNDFVFRYAR